MKKLYMRKLGLLVLLSLFTVGTMVGQKTWYVLNNATEGTGDNALVGWANPDNWTEDPAAQIFSNPGFDIPASGDNVVIKAGKEITLPEGSVVNAGAVTVDGALYIEGSKDAHEMSALLGSGRVYIKGAKLPAGDVSNFISPGSGAGTVVLQGAGPINLSGELEVYNLEIDMDGSEGTVFLQNKLNVNGNLNVKRGKLMFDGASSWTLLVNRNVSVQADGHIGVTTASAFHNMIVKGDFRNYGTVKFSNAEQYEPATNGAVRLTFEGASNNDFVINGSTQLYRLFINKGENDFYTLSVTSNNIDHFKLMGPYEGSTGLETSDSGLEGWERLPLVISKGTLKLGSNIKIDRLGYDRDGVGVKEFHIPSGAALWVNGAEVQTMTSVNNFDIGLTLGGTLKISAGRFVIPAFAKGIRYKGDAEQPARLLMEGGELVTTSIRQNSSDAALAYSQSGGVVQFPYLEGGNQYGYAVFNMINAADVFEMSGGKMVYKVADNNNVSGIHIDVKEGNANVTGGEVVVYTAGLEDRDFKICSTAPIFNLTTIGTHSTREVQMTNEHGSITDTYHYGDFFILGDLSIGAGSIFNAGAYNLFLGGSLDLNGAFTNNGTVVLNGNTNATLTNNTSSVFFIANLNVVKNSNDKVVSLGGTNSFSANKLLLTRGNVDLVGNQLIVNDSLNLLHGSILASEDGFISLANGAVLNSIRGKENSFGNLQINAGATIFLANHGIAKTVSFVGDGVFDIRTYNLEISESDFKDWGWQSTSSKYFLTAGNASDGGLSLNVNLVGNYSNSLVQLFPLRTSAGYSPVGIYAQNNLDANGLVTIVPVNAFHPTVKDEGDVMQYYWNIKIDGLVGVTANNIRYRMLTPVTINNNMNAGVVFDNTDKFDWFGINHTVNSSVIDFNFRTANNFIYGEYTLGKQAAFNKPRVLYSIRSGNYTDNTTWSEASHTGGSLSNNDYPKSYDVVRIGGNPTHGNHQISMTQPGGNGNSYRVPAASRVVIEGKSETAIGIGNDAVAPPTLIVKEGATNQNIHTLAGNGRIVHESAGGLHNSFQLINADYSAFCNSTEAIMEFQNLGKLPTLGQMPYYPNLHVTGTNGSILLDYGNFDLKVNGNLLVDNLTLDIKGQNNGLVDVKGDLIIKNNGVLKTPAQHQHDMVVYGDVVLDNGKLESNAAWNFYLHGNLSSNNGTVNLGSSLRFVGDDDVSVSGTGNLAFSRIFLEKKEGVKVHFTTPFLLNAAADGASNLKPLVLNSGIAHLDNSNIDVILNSGTADFQIPSTSTLIVDNGSKVRASGNGSSLFLDGALVVDNGGKFLWEGAGDNHIKYSATGNASIWLGKDAKFHVGSQLFRNSEGGILNFTQANASSEVRIATIDALMPTKGVFEVLNEGSSFTQSQENSVITVERGQSGSDPVPAIRYNPSTWSVAKGSKMIVGNAATPSSVGLYADQPMGGLDLVGATTLDVWVAPLTLNGTLNIGTGSIFNAADLDLTLKGDLLVNGDFNPGINTTYFSGLVDQQIKGNVTFCNLSKLDGSNSLVIDDLANVEVSNELLVERGNVRTGSKELMVQGNAHIALDASIDGLELKGASLQLLSGGGALGRLVINNNKNVMVPSQPDAITVNGKLVLDQGVFDIGSNLLQLGKDAIITDGDGGSAFSETNMIQTFLSFTDAGVRKYFPAISSNTTFVYPIGSQNKYTPVTLNISEITSSNGYIRVKAANEPHVSILDDTETGLVEPENVLQYYWTVDAVGIEGFRSEVNMQAYADDVVPVSEKDNYIVARIRANEDVWNKEDISDLGVTKNIYFDGINSILVFNGYFFEGTNDLGISGDYTAGLASAIPDKVPTVISVNAGDWNNVATWAVYDPVSGAVGAASAGIPQNGPLGSIVYIRENVGVSQNGRIAYRTVIESGSTLDIGATINNRLGNVSGKGRLRVENGSLPAGFYEEFATTDGGIFEYSGSGDYYVLGGINTLNSVEFTGTGSRKLPDGTLRINGNLLIDGPVVNMVETTALQIGKDLDFNSGSLELGSESKFVFNGNAPQSIGGNQPFTGKNSLQQMVVDNTSGVNVNNDLVINSRLQLVRGPLTPGSAGTIHLGASATAVGASTNSFVNGAMSKAISGNEYFSFPVGKDNRFGAIGITDRTTSGGVWTVEYFNAMPLYRDQTDNVAFVSNSEYWKVTAPSEKAEAAATLRWDDESGINPNGFDAVSIQPHEAVALWRVVNKTSLDKNNQVVGLTKLAHSTSTRERWYSFGLATMPDVGYFTWKGRESADWFNPANWYGNQVPSAGTPAIITLSDDVKPAYWPIIYGIGNPVAQANDLTIDAGITLTLDPGARLTVNGDLSIAKAGGLQIKHETGEGKMASLLTHGGISGEANVQLTLPKEQWFYLGSSIKNSTFGVFDPSQDDQAIVNVYRDRWYGIRAKHVDTPMLQLEGVTGMYLNYDGNINKTLSYSGELNNGEIARTYSEDRYQLFANPYPSFLNWENVEGWERANFEGTMWFRTKVGDAMTFVTYNREAIDGAKVALYPSEDYRNEEELALIAPMQAVFVRPLGASRNLVVSNAARTHGLSNSFLKSTSRSRKGDVVRIEQDNGLSRDGAVVYFADGSEEGLDQGDSEKYKNDDAKVPEIFTRVDGQEVAINGLPVLTEAVRSIPLSVRHQQTGETKLSFDLSYYDGMHNVYFEDKETGAFLNVARNNTYSYRVNDTGVQDDRFVLHFYRVTTDLEVPIVGEEDAGNDISIKSIGDKVLVSVGMDMLQDGFGAVEIYTIEGRKVQEVPARSSRTLVILPGQSGVYIVRAVFGTKVKSERVLVNGK